MNFVADESCAMPVIRALREAGHDVVAIAEVASHLNKDQELIFLGMQKISHCRDLLQYTLNLLLGGQL